jgi:hypothetical protein
LLLAATVREVLEEHGVAVIPNILTSEECTMLEAMMWDWLRDLWADDADRISHDAPQTWPNLQKLKPLHAGLLQHWGVGQTPQAWYVRAHPNVRRVFEEIWGTPELLSSFDGLFWGFPPELTGGIGQYQWPTRKQER